MENAITDRRVKMTKRLLQEALVELMKKKSIHDISVKKICETADINRTTFYHHYESQYDLYNEILDEQMSNLSRIIDARKENTESYTKMLEDVFLYLEANRELYLVLLSENGNLNLGESFTKLIDAFAGDTERSELRRYCAAFISTGLTSVVWMWLNSEPRKSAHDVSMITNAILMSGFRRALVLTRGETGKNS